MLDLLVGAWLFERVHRDGKGFLVIALDGKVLRGAWTDDNAQVTLFSAMLHDKAVTIAQVRVPDGTNEITQVENLLNGVTVPDGEHVMITFDAAHTQRETAEYIKGKREFDYLMTVKGNQPALCLLNPRTLRGREITRPGRPRPLLVATGRSAATVVQHDTTCPQMTYM
jgi:hypothetical protein